MALASFADTACNRKPELSFTLHVPDGVRDQTTWYEVGVFADAACPSGAQLSAGLTALVWGKRGRFSAIGPAALVSAGALADLPSDDTHRVGGLLRVSYGVTTSGRRPWKALSTWGFVEAHWVPGGDGEPGRQEVLVGLRTGPLGLFMMLIPNFDE